MSKYCGPRFRIIRRLGKLIAFSKKEQLKHTTRPGQHGANRVKLTQFAYRLIEKQKLSARFKKSQLSKVCCYAPGRAFVFVSCAFHFRFETKFAKIDESENEIEWNQNEQK